MSEHFTEEQTHRLRAENPLPPPCSYCGAEAGYEDDTIPHVRHDEGCEVATRIRALMGTGG